MMILVYVAIGVCIGIAIAAIANKHERWALNETLSELKQRLARIEKETGNR